jgi:hypothetical protein
MPYCNPADKKYNQGHKRHLTLFQGVAEMKVWQVIDCETEQVLFTFTNLGEAMNKMFRCKGDVTVEAITL